MTTPTYVDSVTCEPLSGYEHGNPSVLLAQYACLHGSIVDEIVPALTQVQERIIENAEEIKKLRDAEMIGLVVGEGQQIPPNIANAGWPSYSIAFVCMCLSFLLLVVVSVGVAIKKLGVVPNVIGGTIIVAAFACAMFVVLVQRYL